MLRRKAKSLVVVHSVLFLCTGNSARSIVAEALLKEMSPESHRSQSAGSHPVGVVNPAALQLLEKYGHDVDHLRSKSWDEFCGDLAPSIDTVITVCDNAAGESCPVWNGSPVTLHWSLPDPAAVADNSARAEAFEAIYADLKDRIADLLRA
jgi:protein-tyrosine-phosphatase